MKVCPKQKVQCVQVGSNTPTKDKTRIRENERQVKLLMRLLLLSNLI